ncbi:CheW-like protein [Leptospira inadai serovar Lyme str. 10]|uniref:CheW-like protein n=2 Tax=Leptospira inadai serovar Lyme TaxID=293084 RepID=V6HYB5_9LEPT|nr:chemotaxis protein CheW [Leptospira inadai]EQA38004.1 CheW-like protein [Leptospira inadai serovar Lyme str. 10]PNV76259.1 chemotaxis protein CheW [Leptospira inadai serovar Lyme]
MKEGGSIKQLLSFTLVGELYGIELEDCKEVDHNKNILKVPHSPEHVLGIVNLRGDVVTILNLMALFGKDWNFIENKSSLIRLKGKKESFAILADSISDIVEIPEENLEPCPSHLNEKESKFIDHISIIKSETIIIVNQQELLRIADE